MSAPDNVKLDDGRVNARILASEAVGDYRRVEKASLKRRVELRSPEAKRCFARFFHSLQLNVHFCSDIARIRLSPEQVEQVEQEIRDAIAKVTRELDAAIEGASVIFNQEGISDSASYDTQPLEMEVGVISSLGRRYLECLEKLDQLMPMLITLEILEVITPSEIDKRRAVYKRMAGNPAKTARRLALGLRMRMNEAAKAAGDPTTAATENNASASGEGAKPTGTTSPSPGVVADGDEHAPASADEGPDSAQMAEAASD